MVSIKSVPEKMPSGSPVSDGRCDGSCDLSIVVLTMESLFSNIIVEALAKALPGQIVGIVRSTSWMGAKGPGGLLALIRNRCGWLYTVLLISQLTVCMLAEAAARCLKRNPAVPSLEAIQALYGIPVRDFEDVNNLEAVDWMKALNPNLIISVYLGQRIKKPVTDLPAFGVINFHPSLLPRHRGPFPIFSTMAAGDEEAGVTVHWVDCGFDTGSVLLRESYAVEPGDTVLGLSHKSSMVGSRVLVEAVKLIAAGNPPRISQDERLATYQSWPSPAEQRRFKQAGGKYGSLLELWKYI